MECAAIGGKKELSTVQIQSQEKIFTCSAAVCQTHCFRVVLAGEAGVLLNLPTAMEVWKSVASHATLRLA